MRQSHCRATAAAPCRESRVVGITRRAEHRVERVRTQAPLRRIGFANDDTALGFEPLHQQCVLRGNVVAQQHRAAGGGNARHVDQVFESQRYAMQPAAGMATRQFLVTHIGLSQQQVVGLQTDHGVEARIHHSNAIQKSLHHLAARVLPRMNGLRQGAGAEFSQWHGNFLSSEFKFNFACATPLRTNDNFDVMPKFGDQFKQFGFADAAKLTARDA